MKKMRLLIVAIFVGTSLLMSQETSLYQLINAIDNSIKAAKLEGRVREGISTRTVDMMKRSVDNLTYYSNSFLSADLDINQKRALVKDFTNLFSNDNSTIMSDVHIGNNRYKKVVNTPLSCAKNLISTTGRYVKESSFFYIDKRDEGGWLYLNGSPCVTFNGNGCFSIVLHTSFVHERKFKSNGKYLTETTEKAIQFELKIDRGDIASVKISAIRVLQSRYSSNDIG